MSILSATGVVLAGQLEDILLKVNRSIGAIIPQCTIEEQHRHDLEITQHPISAGASITDHAYTTPPEVVARYAWSNSGAIFNFNRFQIISSDPKDIFQQLVDLQASRQPFRLVTGKMSYDNMLLKSIEVVTDAESENALLVTLIFKQIIIVTEKTAQLAYSIQADPAATSSPVDRGLVQPKPVPRSVLSTIFGG